jgi:hypothetical protein
MHAFLSSYYGEGKENERKCHEGEKEKGEKNVTEIRTV